MSVKDMTFTKTKVLTTQRIGLPPADEIANLQSTPMTMFEKLLSGDRLW